MLLVTANIDTNSVGRYLILFRDATACGDTVIRAWEFMNAGQAERAMTEPLAMCDFPPTTKDPAENYVLEHAVNSAGQVVTAYCKNTTVAIVKCLPNLTWNATVPSCSAKDKSSDNMTTLLIILWVVGGLLLFSLLVLIVVIITSKSKTRCGRRGTRSQNSSIFHISGRTHGRGGDNPAFTRADEVCGEWSYHRGDNRPELHRLPSYHEAILNNYITVPASIGGPTRQDLPAEGSTSAQPSSQTSAQPSSQTSAQPSSQTSAQPSSQTSTLQRSSNLRADAGQSQGRSERTETSNQIVDEQNTETNQTRDSAPNPTAELGDPSDQPDSSQSRVNIQQEGGATSRRYVENYPQCFFEEEPPPPYTAGATTSPSNRPANHNYQDRRDHHPGRRRSDHALSSSQTTPRQNENDLLQNPNFRRSMCDRLIQAANSESVNAGPRRHTHTYTSNQSSNAADVYARQNYTRPENRTIGTSLYVPNSHLPSDAICANNNYSGGQVSGHSNANNSSGHSNANNSSGHSNGINSSGYSNGSSTSGHFDRNYISLQSNRNHMSGQSGSKLPDNHTTATFQHTPVSSASSSDAFQNVPSISTVSHSNIYSTNQNYAPTIIYNGSSNKYINENNVEHHLNNEATRTSIYPSSATTYQTYHNETLPLGTSTPIDQSPAEVRRFVPPNHSSPLSIPHNQRHHRQSQLALTRQNYTRDGAGYTTTVAQEHPSGPYHGGGHHIPRVSLSAPLARFDGDYTYL